MAHEAVDPGDVDAVEEHVSDGDGGERGDVELADVEPLEPVGDHREPDAVERLDQHAGQDVHVDGRQVRDARDAFAHHKLERDRREQQREAQLQPVRHRRDRRRVHHKRQARNQELQTQPHRVQRAFPFAYEQRENEDK